MVSARAARLRNEMNRIYRRDLVRNAGAVGRWRHGITFDRAAAPSGLNALAEMGVRIPRSLRYMLEKAVSR
jgi:hypothetical protein